MRYLSTQSPRSRLSLSASGALLVIVAACAKGGASDSTRSTGQKASPAGQSHDTEPAAVAISPNATAHDDIEFVRAVDLERAGDALAHGSLTARTIASHPELHYVEARRLTTGSPEVHDEWTDITIVQAGRATLLTGGQLRGGALVSAGEHRGGAIDGGTTHTIAAGDLVTIPAGVPHQYEVQRGDSVRYLTIKVRRITPSH